MNILFPILFAYIMTACLFISYRYQFSGVITRTLLSFGILSFLEP